MPIVDASHTYKPLLTTRYPFRDWRFNWVEDCSDITDWLDGDTGVTGKSTQETFDSKSCFLLYSGSVTNSTAARSRNLGTFGDRLIIQIKLYHAHTLGAFASDSSARLVAKHSDCQFNCCFASDGLFIFDGASWNEVGTNLVQTETWQTWAFDIDFSTPASATVNVYLDGLQASGVDCSQTGTYTSGTVGLTVYSVTVAQQYTYMDYIKMKL